MSWSTAMALAYSRGLEDGRTRREPRWERAMGFESCYRQGFEQGRRSSVQLMPEVEEAFERAAEAAKQGASLERLLDSLDREGQP